MPEIAVRLFVLIRGRSSRVKRALISDIHSNLEAFEAVLADIRSQGITEIFCLGDIIGYGPNPRECIDLVMKCQMCLLGNHDQGALFDPGGIQYRRRTGNFLDARATGKPQAAAPTITPSAGSFLASCRAAIATTAVCTSTVRRAIRSTNTCFRKTRFAAPRNWKAASR